MFFLYHYLSLWSLLDFQHERWESYYLEQYHNDKNTYIVLHTTIIYYYFMWIGTNNRNVNIILLYYIVTDIIIIPISKALTRTTVCQCCATWNFFVGNLYNIIILAMIYTYSTGALVETKRVKLKRVVVVLRQINFHGRTSNGGRFLDPSQELGHIMAIFGVHVVKGWQLSPLSKVLRHRSRRTVHKIIYTKIILVFNIICKKIILVFNIICKKNNISF